MKHTLATTTLTGLAVAALLFPTPSPFVVWNASSSVPVGWYFVTRERPLRGDLALVRLPAEVVDLAHFRQYLPQSAYLLKPVAATSGDRVCRTDRLVIVRNRLRTIARSRDHAGRRLPTWSGCLVLREGELFLIANHDNSFDSRYTGVVEQALVIGRALPLPQFLSKLISKDHLSK